MKEEAERRREWEREESERVREAGRGGESEREKGRVGEESGEGGEGEECDKLISTVAMKC